MDAQFLTIRNKHEAFQNPATRSAGPAIRSQIMRFCGGRLGNHAARGSGQLRDAHEKDESA